MSTSPLTSAAPSLADLYERMKRLSLDLRAYHLEALDDSVPLSAIERVEAATIDIRSAVRSRVNRAALEAGEGTVNLAY